MNVRPKELLAWIILGSVLGAIVFLILGIYNIRLLGLAIYNNNRFYKDFFYVGYPHNPYLYLLIESIKKVRNRPFTSSTNLDHQPHPLAPMIPGSIFWGYRSSYPNPQFHNIRPAFHQISVCRFSFLCHIKDLIQNYNVPRFQPLFNTTHCADG